MLADSVPDLSECSELRQLLEARQPRIVHGTVFLLSALALAGVLWLACTRADLVVDAAGRVRPVDVPRRVLATVPGSLLSPGHRGRVVEVSFREGDVVRKGSVLVRLDTGRLQNEIRRARQTIHAGEAELEALARLVELLSQRSALATERIRAELKQAEEEVLEVEKRRASERRLAEIELKRAQAQLERSRQLAAAGIVSEADLSESTAIVALAREELVRSQFPVGRGRTDALRKALVLEQKNLAVSQEELRIKRVARQRETEAARIQLANLELEAEKALIVAPVDGVVTRGKVKVGDSLEAGSPVVEIAEQKGFYFAAAVPTDDVADLRPGMSARIQLDAYDVQKFGSVEGKVVYVSPDSEPIDGTEAESMSPGSLSPAQEHAAFYTVRVELASNAVGRGKKRGPVKLGMTGRVSIVCGEERLLSLLVNGFRRSLSLR